MIIIATLYWSWSEKGLLEQSADHARTHEKTEPDLTFFPSFVWEAIRIAGRFPVVANSLLRGPSLSLNVYYNQCEKPSNCNIRWPLFVSREDTVQTAAEVKGKKRKSAPSSVCPTRLFFVRFTYRLPCTIFSTPDLLSDPCKFRIEKTNIISHGNDELIGAHAPLRSKIHKLLMTCKMYVMYYDHRSPPKGFCIVTALDEWKYDY